MTKTMMWQRWIEGDAKQSKNSLIGQQQCLLTERGGEGHTARYSTKLSIQSHRSTRCVGVWSFQHNQCPSDGSHIVASQRRETSRSHLLAVLVRAAECLDDEALATVQTIGQVPLVARLEVLRPQRWHGGRGCGNNTHRTVALALSSKLIQHPCQQSQSDRRTKKHHLVHLSSTSTHMHGILA